MSQTLWITGLPGAGKTTLARLLKSELDRRDLSCVMLDGDELRRGLSSNLGFSPADRRENIRRAAEVAALFNRAGSLAVVALISPMADDRALARSIIGSTAMIEVYLSTSLMICESRDPKGLYNRARLGEIADFTGVSAPYEVPQSPMLTLDTAVLSTAECVMRTLSLVVV